MGRGNYIPPISSYSRADYSTIYVRYEIICGEEYWQDENSYIAMIEEDFKANAMYEFIAKFKSFEINDKQWLRDHSTKVIAENNLCMLTICYDETYIAISVISKDDDEKIVNLANKHLDSYANALKKIVLRLYGEYRYRTSAWTSATVRREQVA